MVCKKILSVKTFVGKKKRPKDIRYVAKKMIR